MPNGPGEMKYLMKAPASDFQSAEDYSFHQVVENTRLSSFRKYQALAVGDRSFLSFLKYELLLGTIAFFPGAAGILFRQYLYRFVLNRLGRGAIIGRSVTLRHPSKISIGIDTVVDDYCVLNALGSERSGIILGNKVFVGRNTVLKTRDGRITIHDYADIGHNCYIGTTQNIEIGQHTLIAAYCCIGGSQHRMEDLDTPIALQGFSRNGGVVIEDDVWIGVNVVIHDGVRIAKGSAIGTGSVVTTSIPPYSIACGVPARVVKKRS